MRTTTKTALLGLALALPGCVVVRTPRSMLLGGGSIGLFVLVIITLAVLFGRRH